jgi:putative membrane protein
MAQKGEDSDSGESSSDKVKQFGQRMIDDHTKAGDQLKSIAAKDNIDIPSELDAKHKAMVDKYRVFQGLHSIADTWPIW